MENQIDVNGIEVPAKVVTLSYIFRAIKDQKKNLAVKITEDENAAIKDFGNTLMKDDSFASTYAKLERAIGDFGYQASNYAKTGAELDLDYADTIERNLDKISAATEGFIGKGKDGALKHLQDMVHAIGDRINAMLNNLFRRLRPQ